MLLAKESVCLAEYGAGCGEELADDSGSQMFEARGEQLAGIIPRTAKEPPCECEPD